MPDFTNCPCAGGTLDRLIQPAVLIVLAEGTIHGYPLAARVRERFSLGGQKPGMSGIYRFLKVMEERGLVVSSWDLAHRGPARRRYAITPDGLRCLAQWVETLQRYRDGINDLLGAARIAVKKQAETAEAPRS